MDIISAADEQQVLELALANQILALKGILDAFGHVSARSLNRPDRYFLSRNLAPSLIRANDIHLYDLDGRCMSNPEVSSYLERFIHGEIYRMRPDVMSIVHAHTHSVVPFGLVSSVPLKPVLHMAGFLGEGLPIFEIRRVDDESDMLIRSGKLGAALAEDLGLAPAVLMRGHGVTVVGTSIRQAVFRAFYLDVNARILSVAHGLGQPVFLNNAEAVAASSSNDTCLNRPWELWEREVREINAASARHGSAS